MFGLKIAIGAVDNTTGVLRGIGSTLKKFSSNVRTWLNLAGFTVIARQITRILDSAMSASGYATEWEQFKQRMANSWEGIAGRIGDLFGPLIDDAENIGNAMIDGVNAFIGRLQYAISFWKRAAPEWMGGQGQSFENAAAGASGDVVQKEAARIARIREHRRQTTVEANAGIEAHGSLDPRWMSRPTTMKERAKVRMMQMQNQAVRDSKIAGQVGISEEGGHLLRSGPQGEFVGHGFGMNKTYSGFKRYRDTAEAKAERKWQKKVDEARRKESRGIKLSAKMQAVLDKDNADQQAKKDAKDKAAQQKAIQDTADNTKGMYDAMKQSFATDGGW